jgi:hypothetical protein
VHCEECPEGYACIDEGIGLYGLYECPVGNYCMNGLDPIECPAGTYGNERGASDESVCQTCPKGFFCKEGTVVPIPCPGGYYCPEGGDREFLCVGGYYCPEGAGEYTEFLCPAAYYCPEGSSIYIKCPDGTYCEEGQEEPLVCPVGTTGNGNPDNVSMSVACSKCSPGYYSDITSDYMSCLPCEAGYVCLEGCTTATPIGYDEDPEDDDKGYPCPAGFYCPEGSYEAVSCPRGTYSEVEKAVDISACGTCPKGTFNEYEGMTECTSCGSTSTSDGGLSCLCLGGHRSFQMSDQTCLCKPQYLPKHGGEDSDSTDDCEPQIFPRCDNKQVLDVSGFCVDLDQCDTACDGGPGTRSPELGICACQKVDEIDDVCNKSCRDDSIKVEVSPDGLYTINFPADSDGNAPQSQSFDMQEVEGFYGAVRCSNTLGVGCKAVSLKVGITIDTEDIIQGGFSANYQANSQVLAKIEYEEDETRRRLVSSLDTGIRNPVFCLNLGDSMLFEGITQEHYPVYLKDSLANSNDDFDYGAFRDLEDQLKNGVTITTFAYSFSQEGIYIFGDAADEQKQTIIGVMGENKKCSEEDKYIVPITYDALLKLGVTQKEDIILSPDWALIIGLLSSLLLGTPALIGLIYYFSKTSFLKLNENDPHYRKLNRKEKLSQMRAKGTVLESSSMKPSQKDLDATKNMTFSVLDQSDLHVLVEDEIAEIGRDSKKDKKFKAIRKKENAEGVHEIEPEVFQEIYAELQDHTSFIKNEFTKQATKDQSNIGEVFGKVNELKKLMEDKLCQIAGSYGRNIRLIFGRRHKNASQEKDDTLIDENKSEVSSSSSESSDEDEQIVEDETASQDGANDELASFRRESISSLLEAGEQMDEEAFGKAIQKIDAQKDQFLTSFKKDEEQSQRKLRLQLEKNRTLDVEQKKNIIEDYEMKMDKVNKLLMLEEKRQDDGLRKKMEERRGRREMLEDKIRHLQKIEYDERNQLFFDKRSLQEKRKSEEDAVDHEIKALLEEEKKEIKKTKQTELQNVKVKFQRKLAKMQESDAVGFMLTKYESEIGFLEKTLENERAQLEEDAIMKFEMKRMERRKNIRDKYKEFEGNLAVVDPEVKQEMKIQIEKLSNNIENVDLEEDLNEKMEEEEEKMGKNNEEIFNIRSRYKEAYKEINKSEQKELKEIQKEFQQAEKEEKKELTNEKKQVIIDSELKLTKI